jgi:hypothetical protein
LSGQPVILPPRLADLLIGLAGTARSSSAVGRAIPGTGWLFPGWAPRRHITANYLNTKLKAAGIQVRPARNGTVIALAEDVPAAVRADFLGMHVNTAERWGQARAPGLGRLSPGSNGEGDVAAGGHHVGRSGCRPAMVLPFAGRDGIIPAMIERIEPAPVG